jgi:Bacterial Ig domain
VRLCCFSIALSLVAACGPHEPEWSSEPLGQVALAALGSAHDVAHVAFRLVEPTGDCVNGPLVASDTVALGTTALDDHRFGAALFVVGTGGYLACADLLQADLSPSAECAPASATVLVNEGQTSTVSLVSACTTSTGGVDVSLALNEAPVIDDVQVSPSKFIEHCETATLAVNATDPEGDALSYSWSVTQQPVGATPVLAPAADTATFGADLAGDYEVTVTVSDVHSASSVATFPMHVSLGTCLPAGHVDWLIAGGGTQSDEMSALAIAPSGNLFATAIFYSTVDFGGGPLTAFSSRDAVLLEISPSGSIVTQRQFGSLGNEEPRALAVDAAGDVILAGNFSTRLDLGCGEHVGLGGHDAFVGKLDGTTGACLWSHAFGGGGNDFATAVGVDAAGNVVVGGKFGSSSITIPGGSTFTSAGNFDVFYASFDANGSHRWDHQLGGSSPDELVDLDIDAAGDVVIVGATAAGPVTFDPGVVSPTTLGKDLFVAKLAGGTGNVVQLLMPTASGNDDAQSVAFDPIGDIVVAFELEGTVDLGDGPMTVTSQRDVVIARLSGDDLSLDWSQHFTAATWASVRHVAVDAVGDVRVIGDFHSSLTLGATTLSTANDDDIFVTSLNGIHGAPQWVIAGGSLAGDDEATPALAVDASGATYAGGRFGNNAQPGFVLGDSSPPVTNNGNWDAFVAKIAP